MKIDKEYPATHSMSTAWYVVDDEGNIGIVDYDDDGPVPWGTVQTVVEEIVFGPDEIGKDGQPIKFNLTDQQVLDAEFNQQTQQS